MEKKPSNKPIQEVVEKNRDIELFQTNNIPLRNKLHNCLTKKIRLFKKILLQVTE